MSYKLLAPEDCVLTVILLTVADYANLKVEVQPLKVEGAAFTLVTPDGIHIEGYLGALVFMARAAAPFLLGSGKPVEEALVLSFFTKLEHRLLVPLRVCKRLPSTSDADKGIENVSSFIKDIDALLLKQTFLVGERITLADIAIASTLYAGLQEEKRDTLLKSHENVLRWFTLIVNQDIIKTRLTPGPPTLNKKSNPEEDVGSKKDNALNSLPPSSLVLDAWKRQYSNEKDIRGISMPWFWSNYDRQGYSLWYMRYDRTEGENTVDYAAANMLNGFLQRLDANFRKYSFAVLNVVGEKPQYDILGVWLIRGHDIPTELLEHPSFEYYMFKQLDENRPEDKALIDDYWCNADSVEGRPISSCKVWK